MICRGAVVRSGRRLPFGAVAATAALALAACSGGEAPAATGPATPPSSSAAPASSSTTVASAADPYAVPAVVDAAYVERVLAALYAVHGDAIRAVVATGRIGFEEQQRLRAVYDDQQLGIELDFLGRTVAGELSVFRDPPGDRRAFDAEILEAPPDCIVASVRLDFSAVVKSPPTTAAGERTLVILRPRAVADDPQRLNPTPWWMYRVKTIGDDPRQEPGCSDP